MKRYKKKNAENLKSTYIFREFYRCIIFNMETGLLCNFKTIADIFIKFGTYERVVN